MRIWLYDDGGCITEPELMKEFIRGQQALEIAPEMNFSDYIRECEGKNGFLTLVGPKTKID